VHGFIIQRHTAAQRPMPNSAMPRIKMMALRAIVPSKWLAAISKLTKMMIIPPNTAEVMENPINTPALRKR